MDKFPSIHHLPFSPQVHNDDKILPSSSCKHFLQSKPTSLSSPKENDVNEICIHEKLDGGNCCIHKGLIYARTHSSPTKHPWFNTMVFFKEPFYSKYMFFGKKKRDVQSSHKPSVFLKRERTKRTAPVA